MMIIKRQSGFTLIEFIVTLGIFAAVSIPLFGFTAYSLMMSEQLLVKSYLLENARITLDFLTTEIRLSEEISFTIIDDDNNEFSASNSNVDPNKIYRLSNVRFRGISPNNTAIVVYNLTEEILNQKYHRVDFGGSNKDYGDEGETSGFYVGELSRYIADIKIAFDFDSELVYIKVVTDDRINYSGDMITMPIVLEGTVSLTNKTIKNF